MRGDPTGDEVRFLRKRVGKSSKDFAQLVGLTSEQYSRMENGAVSLTASNDKLFRLMVIAMSVLGALMEPALRERVANQTWDTGYWPGAANHRPGRRNVLVGRGNKGCLIPCYTSYAGTSRLSPFVPFVLSPFVPEPERMYGKACLLAANRLSVSGHMDTNP